MGRDPIQVRPRIPVDMLMVKHERVEMLSVLSALDLMDDLLAGERFMRVGLLDESL
jgi:hypothetical protein